MSTNKKNDSTMSLLMIVAGVGIVLFSIFYVFSNCNEKAKGYKSEIDVLDQTIADREEKVSKEGYYKEQITANNSAKAKVLKYFPADIKAEDDLLFCKEIEDTLAFYYTTKGSFNNPIIFYADNASSLVGYTRVCEYDFSASYGSLKDMVDYINYYKYRRAITDLKVASEGGILTGSMTVNEYYVVGGGNTYESPVINNVALENKNPFGVLDGLTKEEYEKDFMNGIQ